MLEGLWTVEFISNHPDTGGRYGGGAVIFETGRMFGGDSLYYYIGCYQVASRRVKATVKVTHFSGAPESIFGEATQFSLSLGGKLGDPMMNMKMNMKGHVIGNNDLKITLRLIRRADLP